MEEYERTQRGEKRDDDANALSREANGISRESNQISRKANRKSTVALVLSGIAILAELVINFYPYLAELWQRLFHG